MTDNKTPSEGSRKAAKEWYHRTISIPLTDDEFIDRTALLLDAARADERGKCVGVCQVARARLSFDDEPLAVTIIEDCIKVMRKV